jgi:glycosyltransferase involved in cell wall biosynthesis
LNSKLGSSVQARAFAIFSHDRTASGSLKMILPNRDLILHVHTVPVISGSGINTLLTMKGSHARGYPVALACSSRGRLTEEVEKAGIRVHLIPQMDREISPGWDAAAVFALLVLIRRHRYSLVHTHNSKAGFIGRLAARLARVPTVIHTVHGFAFHDSESAGRQVLFRHLERLAARWCDGMIFVSELLVDWASRERIGMRLPKTVIYSGIDVEAFQSADGGAFRKHWGIAQERPVVGMVAKLWEGKGHHVLLNAWKGVLEAGLVPAPLLLLAGEGPLEATLKRQVSALNLEDSVLFTGFQHDVPTVTAALDVAVLPSFFEGMGRALLEAMAAGKPVVASRVGGIPSLVFHNKNGLLVEPGDPDALKMALLDVLSQQDLRRRLSEGARASIRPEYSASHMVNEIHRFYDQVKGT